MIHFMLYAYCQQAAGLKCKRLALPIQSFDCHLLGSRDFTEHTRYGQAAFFVIGLTATRNDLRIDQDIQLVTAIGYVDYNDLLMHVHLCGDAGMGALDRLADYTDAELDEVIAASLRQQLAAGVTTVRDLGDRRYAVVDWWKAR